MGENMLIPASKGRHIGACQQRGQGNDSNTRLPSDYSRSATSMLVDNWCKVLADKVGKTMNGAS